jgi:hypothetical protein
MRATIGIIALVLLAVGLFTRNTVDDQLLAAGGASLRVGVVMAIWWLAYPQAQKLPIWLVVACIVTLLLVMRWPKLLLVAIPLLAVLWFLGPRARRGGLGS